MRISVAVAIAAAAMLVGCGGDDDRGGGASYEVACGGGGTMDFFCRNAETGERLDREIYGVGCIDETGHVVNEAQPWCTVSGDAGALTMPECRPITTGVRPSAPVCCLDDDPSSCPP